MRRNRYHRQDMAHMQRQVEKAARERDAYKPDAERLRWLCEHALDEVNDGRRVWQWIDDNRLRLGGLRAAVDCLMGGNNE
jgi:hypothetical protein